jgi:hypothetical protein
MSTLRALQTASGNGNEVIVKLFRSHNVDIAHSPGEAEYEPFPRLIGIAGRHSIDVNAEADPKLLSLPVPHNLQYIILSSPKSSITISSLNNSSTTNKMKAGIEEYTRMEWD